MDRMDLALAVGLIIGSLAVMPKIDDVLAEDPHVASDGRAPVRICVKVSVGRDLALERSQEDRVVEVRTHEATQAPEASEGDRDPYAIGDHNVDCGEQPTQNGDVLQLREPFRGGEMVVVDDVCDRSAALDLAGPPSSAPMGRHER